MIFWYTYHILDCKSIIFTFSISGEILNRPNKLSYTVLRIQVLHCGDLLLCHIPELSVFFLLQLNSFLLDRVHVIPLLSPAVTHAAGAENLTPLEVLSDFLTEHSLTDSASTCHSKGRGIRRNPTGSWASATRSHPRISSPERKKRANVKLQFLASFFKLLIDYKYLVNDFWSHFFLFFSINLDLSLVFIKLEHTWLCVFSLNWDQWGSIALYDIIKGWFSEVCVEHTILWNKQFLESSTSDTEALSEDIAKVNCTSYSARLYPHSQHHTNGIQYHNLKSTQWTGLLTPNNLSPSSTTASSTDSFVLLMWILNDNDNTYQATLVIIKVIRIAWVFFAWVFKKNVIL